MLIGIAAEGDVEGVWVVVISVVVVVGHGLGIVGDVIGEVVLVSVVVGGHSSVIIGDVTSEVVVVGIWVVVIGEVIGDVVTVVVGIGDGVRTSGGIGLICLR